MVSSSWFSALIMALLIFVIELPYQKIISFCLSLLAFKIQLLASTDRCKYCFDQSPKIIQSSSKTFLMVVPSKPHLMDTLACEDSISIWARTCAGRPSGDLVGALWIKSGLCIKLRNRQHEWTWYHIILRGQLVQSPFRCCNPTWSIPDNPDKWLSNLPLKEAYHLLD